MDGYVPFQTCGKHRIAEIERRHKAIRQKLDRLDQAFLFERTIDIDTYDRHRDNLCEELTLVQMDPPLRGTRGTRRRGHPGVRRTRSTERVEPLGSLVARSEAAVAAGVFPGWRSVRREKTCWNRHNPAGFQLLGFGFGREKRIGGPDGSRTRDLMNAIHARSQLRYWPTLG